MNRESVCNRDCFNCQYDDCICDEMDASDWNEARKTDDFIKPKSPKEKKIAAKQAAYRDSHREEIAAKKAAYYDSHREEIAAYQAAYRDSHREEIAAYQAAYYDSHREEWRPHGDRLRAVRKRLKLSQADAGKLIGLSQRQMSFYERGEVPFDLNLIERLEEYEKCPATAGTVTER